MGEEERTGSRPAVEAPFGQALAALARERPDIVGLTADLGKYTDILPFRDAFPDRFFNVGMAEQNLIAVSAGLARTGHTAYCTTYGVFATRRAYDFIAIACAHARLNVKIFAGLPGLTTGYGGTHQAIEDLGADADDPGPGGDRPVRRDRDRAGDRGGRGASTARSTCRLPRASCRACSTPRATASRIGAGYVLREGGKIGMISTGLMTERALDAADELASRGIKVSRAAHADHQAVRHERSWPTSRRASSAS